MARHPASGRRLNLSRANSSASQRTSTLPAKSSDDSWKDRQESAFRNWFNHMVNQPNDGLVTTAASLMTAQTSHWCRRLTLRILSRVCEQIRNTQFCVVMEKLSKEIFSHRIAFCTGRDLCDVGLQDKLNKLISSYSSACLLLRCSPLTTQICVTV
jgi:hypothetical protein